MSSNCTFLAQVFSCISLCTIFSANKEEVGGKSFYIKLINLQQVIFKSAEAKWRPCFFPLYWSRYTNGLLALYFAVSQGLVELAFYLQITAGWVANDSIFLNNFPFSVTGEFLQSKCFLYIDNDFWLCSIFQASNHQKRKAHHQEQTTKFFCAHDRGLIDLIHDIFYYGIYSFELYIFINGNRSNYMLTINRDWLFFSPSLVLFCAHFNSIINLQRMYKRPASTTSEVLDFLINRHSNSYFLGFVSHGIICMQILHLIAWSESTNLFSYF